MDEEDIWLLNVEVTTVAGKCRLKLVTDQRKITQSVIMSHEINTSVPNISDSNRMAECHDYSWSSNRH